MPIPPALHPGTRIGVVAPGSAPEDADAFAAGCRRIEARGYRLVKGRETYEQRGYLSGTDADRLHELNRMLEREDLSALFCARGGYGTLRLLDRVDYESVQNAPKLLVGYSDITALQLALLTRAGVPSVSGPMIASDWHDLDDRSEETFWSIVSAAGPLVISPADGSRPGVQQAGTAEGPLIGGNLSVLTRLLGTPYLPSLDGAILFLEDVDEPPYRIDGMLAQLRLAGVLGTIDGMIFGRFTDSTPKPGKPSLTMAEVIDDYSEFIDGPTVTDFAYGHCRPFTSIPIGVNARLTAADDGVELTMVEPVTDVGNI